MKNYILCLHRLCLLWTCATISIFSMDRPAASSDDHPKPYERQIPAEHDLQKAIRILNYYPQYSAKVGSISDEENDQSEDDNYVSSEHRVTLSVFNPGSTIQLLNTSFQNMSLLPAKPPAAKVRKRRDDGDKVVTPEKIKKIKPPAELQGGNPALSQNNTPSHNIFLPQPK